MSIANEIVFRILFLVFLVMNVSPLEAQDRVLKPVLEPVSGSFVQEPSLTNLLVQQALGQADSPSESFETLGQEYRVGNDSERFYHPSPYGVGRCDPSEETCIAHTERVRFRPSGLNWCNPPFVNFAVQRSRLFKESPTASLVFEHGLQEMDRWTIEPSFLHTQYIAYAAARNCEGAYIAVVDGYWSAFRYPMYRAVFHLGTPSNLSQETPECFEAGKWSNDCSVRFFDPTGRTEPPTTFYQVETAFQSTADDPNGTSADQLLIGPSFFVNRRFSLAETINLPSVSQMGIRSLIGFSPLSFVSPARGVPIRTPEEQTSFSVLEVDLGSDAWNAGLRAHMSISRVDLSGPTTGRLSNDPMTLFFADRYALPGDEFSLLVIQENGSETELTFEVTNKTTSPPQRPEPSTDQLVMPGPDAISEGCRDSALLTVGNSVSGYSNVWFTIDRCEKVIWARPSQVPAGTFDNVAFFEYDTKFY